MIISIVNNWKDAESEHKNYLSEIISDFLKPRKTLLGPQTPAFHFITETKELILSSKLEDIIKSIEIFIRYKKAAGGQHEFLSDELKKIFNYNKFTRKSGKWNAYSLCRKSKCRICPYCNHAYAFTVKSENGDFRPTLDHFFSKDDYPHLSLTLYNLVPSCSPCNSSLKGTDNFYTTPHLNPLFDLNNIEFYFSIDGFAGELPDAISRTSSDLKIKARPTTKCAKSENSLSTFVINERYEVLLNEAIDFHLAKTNLNEALLNDQLGLTFNESTLLRFNRDTYEQYLLGKMFADIYDSFNT